MKVDCKMVNQGYVAGSCMVTLPDGSQLSACKATLKKEGDLYYRLIKSAHLSRPEDYFSIYQSGCNHSCLKCHSWRFTKIYNGFFISTDEIAKLCADYESTVTVSEPREKATMWHATDLCYHCGSCVIKGTRSFLCPKKLEPEQIVLSPQGYGPARNIVAFTGGDVACNAEFYAQATEKIKQVCKNIWVLLETNGYGLTPENLDVLAAAGLDSFWLDIKAYDEAIYKKLCGASNKWILKAPEEIIKRGFTLEVLSLFIPNWVEEDQLVKIARLLYSVDPEIPFTLLAFFPEYKLQANRSPSLMEMLRAYLAVKEVGLKKVKLANCNIFARTESDWETLIAVVGREGLG